MSDKTKHTPGPWEIKPEESNRNYIRIRGSLVGELYKIANVPLPDYDCERDAKECRANTRLIAAAPDLLEALQNLVDQCEQEPGWHQAPAIQSARAAIAKAEGRIE